MSPLPLSIKCTELHIYIPVFIDSFKHYRWSLKPPLKHLKGLAIFKINIVINEVAILHIYDVYLNTKCLDEHVSMNLYHFCI